MSKLIIHAEGVDDAKALQLVSAVVANGLVSQTSKGKQYCFAAVWEPDFQVYATKNKGDTHTFRVRRIAK